MYNCIYIWIDQPVPVSVQIEPSANQIQAGTEVSFDASVDNEGTSPVYQWMVNGLNVGTNSPTYSYFPLNGDEVVCVVTSNAYCVSNNPAASNVVIMEVQGLPPVVSVTGIIGNGQTKCYNAKDILKIAGGGETFAVHNGGSVTMVAGEKIYYLPGTVVMPGGYMHGYITTNNQYCGQQTPSIPTVVTSTEELPAGIMKTVFSIYPNPTSGNFMLEQKSGADFTSVTVEIYSMRGERILTERLAGEKKREFAVSDLPQGLYFVKVVAENYTETFKLVKTK
jgi:hypothetical protein